DWKWFAVRLKHTDMEYLRKHWSGKKASAPTLEKKHDKYFLRFTYAEEVSLNRTRKTFREEKAETADVEKT
ncbi:MAG: hypothetical protein V8Q92_12435, partial [Coprococcus comes]